MTIAAEIARLAVVEALCPTANIASSTGFPTLAGPRVYDSRTTSVSDLEGQGPTPTLSVFTRSAASRRRGEGSSSASRFGRTMIEITAEVSVVDQDDDGPFVDALAVGPDPQARITLAALCAQVRYVLTVGPSGAIFRKACMAIENIEIEQAAVPELGLRWHRNVMTLDCQIPDDAWGATGGLPEPAASILQLFPTGSAARVAMAGLAGQFAALPAKPTLQTIAFDTKQGGVSGQAGTTPSVHPPFANLPE